MATNGKDATGEAERKSTCFVVCPIGSDASPERKHSNQVYRYLILPVLEAAGFEKPLRSDMIAEGGNISRQIINHILEDDLVIADLTGRNPNVYYELAVRHCTAKPFIQLISKGETIPFDISQQRTIFFDRTDLDSVEEAKAELAQHVASAMKTGVPVDTPIGAALDFEKLRAGDSTDRVLSSLVDRIDRLLGPRRELAAAGAVDTLKRFAFERGAKTPAEALKLFEALKYVGTDGYHDVAKIPYSLEPALLEALRHPSIQKTLDAALHEMERASDQQDPAGMPERADVTIGNRVRLPSD